MEDKEQWKKHQKLQKEIFKLEDENVTDYRKKLELQREILKLGHARSRRKDAIFEKQGRIRMLYGVEGTFEEKELDEEFRKDSK